MLFYLEFWVCVHTFIQTQNFFKPKILLWTISWPLKWIWFRTDIEFEGEKKWKLEMEFKGEKKWRLEMEFEGEKKWSLEINWRRIWCFLKLNFFGFHPPMSCHQCHVTRCLTPQYFRKERLTLENKIKQNSTYNDFIKKKIYRLK